MSDMKTLVRAKPHTAGQYFLGGEVPADHHCKAACYRIAPKGHRITTMCDYGHVVASRDTGPQSHFGGSAFQASLNDLPAFAPFIEATP
jgi:hypothetical protein